MAVYTCTMNLAIDLFIETDKMIPFTVNRTRNSDIQANGKGVNVSLVLKQLGIESCAMGFSAGFTGKYIADYLADKGISNSFVDVEGLTRINVFTKVNDEKLEYKLVNQGPFVKQEAQQVLLTQVANLKVDDYLVVSGSLPMGMEPTILVQIAKLCHEKKVHLILDVSHPIIMDCLAYHPYLIKPNEEELAEWFNCGVINEEEDFLRYGSKLIQKGASAVLISLGADGAIYLDDNGLYYRSNAPCGKVVNTACAGDTLLGTFLAEKLKGRSTVDCLSKSVAAGSSTAFRSGITDFSDVDNLQKEITVIKKEVTYDNL